MSDIAPGRVIGRPGADGGGGGGNGAGRLAARGLGAFARQREATVLVVTVAMLLYFGISHFSTFVSRANAIDLLSEIFAGIAIIAIGEVLLLICGEIDISVGFTYAFVPFVMHFLIDYYGVPGILGIILALVVAAAIGWVNAFVTVTIGVPSFITTLGTGFVLSGLILTLAHGEQAAVPPKVLGIGHWIGTYAFAEITWAVILTVLFHVLLRNTRWGLHTIAVGGNLLGAAEAGVNVARIKYGNFMLCAVLGGFVGIQIAFQDNLIDTFAGGAAYQPMFYAVAAAVLGGTSMLGGSGTMIGAFLGAAVLTILQDGFAVLGISAYPLEIFFGGAILISMIASVQLARLRAGGRLRR